MSNKLTDREYKAIIVLLIIIVVLLSIIITVRHLQPPQDHSSGNNTSMNKGFQSNPKRESYIQARDSYYIAAEEYYRHQKEYYSNRTKQYNSAAQKPQSYNHQGTISSKSKPDQNNEAGASRHSTKFKTLTPIDPNEADSALLCSIPGIGKTISANILQYRERLGGFAKTEQLLECKFFTEDLLQWFKIGDKPQLRHLYINKASYAQLIAHPYIGKRETQDILGYRRTYGAFANEDALRVSGIFSEETLIKLSPYIEY